MCPPTPVLLQEIPSHTLPKVPATCPTKSGPLWKLTITLSTFPTMVPARLPAFQSCSSGGLTKAATKVAKNSIFGDETWPQFSAALEEESKN